MTVTAVVVTYNRKHLFAECIEALLGQTIQLDKIIVIDNASTDGTDLLVREKRWIELPAFDYYKMNTNLGGAGGFCKGLEIAREGSSDWIWLMDDDTIPKKDCLEQLLEAERTINSLRESANENKETAFLASAVYGENDEFMNLPHIDLREGDNGYASWYKYLSYGIVSISDATFVSVLINKKAVEKCGLPCKEYFIWGDDIEYTTRLTKYFGEGYFVGKSIAIHKRVNARKLEITTEKDVNRIKLYHNKYRNLTINQRLYKNLKHPEILLVKASLSCLRLLPSEHGFAKYKEIVKGYFEAITWYDRIKSYIENQIR